MHRDQNSLGDSTENGKTAWRNFFIILLSVLLAVLLLVNIITAAWIANQFRDEAIQPDRANILIVWSGSRLVNRKSADWLALSLQEAGYNVRSESLDHLAVQDGINQPLWIMTIGTTVGNAVDLALSRPQANLMIVDPVPADDQNWLDWANQTASRWPPEKKLFLISSKSENDSLLTLYELMSGEDAVLFPGFDTARGRNIETWLSLDANYGLSIVPLGSLRLPWLSAALIDEITAVITGQSIVMEIESAPVSISDRVNQAGQKIQTIRLVSYISVISFLFFQIVLAQLWLLLITRNLVRAKIKVMGSDFLVLSFLLLSLIAFSLAVLFMHGLAILPPLAWYLLALILLLSVMFALPAAYQGNRQRQEYLDQFEPKQFEETDRPTDHNYKPDNFFRILSLVFSVIMLLAVTVTIIYFLIVGRGQPDSWFWLAAAAALLLAGRFAARQLAFAGGGSLIACLAGGWLTILAFSLLSSYLS